MDQTPKGKREIAQSEVRDKTAKVIAGMLPMGSAAYELLTTLVVPLHEKKKQEFIDDLASRLKKLEGKGQVDIEELAENEEFNTIITKAILLAQQNHQKEKLEALRNIVLKSTEWLSKGEPIFDWSHKFLMIVDQISPLHILLLKTFRNPAKVVQEKEITLKERTGFDNADIFFRIYPELKSRSMLVNQCWKELYNFGFLGTIEFFDIKEMEDMQYMHSHDRIVPQTTDFGNKFLNMIED